MADQEPVAAGAAIQEALAAVGPADPPVAPQAAPQVPQEAQGPHP